MGRAAAAAEQSAKRWRVLVADDNLDTREILSHLLARLDCDVVMAKDGQAAITAFESDTPDLVILDVMMPKLDGIEVCRRIKSGPTRFVPVLMLSAQNMSANAVDGLDAGADEYVGKPFDPDELLARARALLRIKRLQDELAESRTLLAATNRELDMRVRQQVEELVRLSRLRRYLAPGVVDSVLAGGVDPATRAPLRKEVSVVFGDIRGFTRLADQLEPDEVTELLADFLEEMSEAVFAQSGTVNKILGDGLLAVWNDPVEQKDHVERAVRTALAMTDRARRLQARLHTRLPEPFAIGVGVHTGPAVVGSIGRGRILDYTAIGSAVNLASRVQAIATDNQVVATDAVISSLRGALDLRNERRESLRGFAHPVKVAEVLGFKALDS